MAGLNSILSNTENTTLTLPKWYDTAQQGIVNASLTQAQAPSQAQNFATSTFAPGATNPFTSANSTLQTIGSGAANPWNVTTDASGKQTVTPNVSTPMGGLFSAQTDYLNKMMPDVVAPAEAQGVGAGGFGSSQARYGVEKARSGALSDLFQKQMAEALANQQTGVSAASAQGTVGGQGIKGALDTAAYPTALHYSVPVTAVYLTEFPFLDDEDFFFFDVEGRRCHHEGSHGHGNGHRGRHHHN